MKFSDKGILIIGILLAVSAFVGTVLLGAHVLTYRQFKDIDYSTDVLIYPSAFSNINFPEFADANIYDIKITKNETNKESRVFLEIKNPEISPVTFYDNALIKDGWKGPDLNYSGNGTYVGFYQKDNYSLTLIISDIEKPKYDVKAYLISKL